MESQGSRLLESLSTCPPAITHAGVPLHPLFLQIPQQQGPTLPIHWDGRLTCPHQGTVDIDHSARGFSTDAAVLLIQRQGALPTGNQSLQTAPDLLSRALRNGADRPQTDRLAQQFLQRALKPTRAGMPLHQQRQDGTLDRRGPFAWHRLALHTFLQGVDSFLFPTIQRVPQGLALATAFTQQAVGRGRSLQFADPLDTLLNRAPMVPVSSLKMVTVFFIISFRDSSCRSFHHLSQWFTPGLNHALDFYGEINGQRHITCTCECSH